MKKILSTIYEGQVLDDFVEKPPPIKKNGGKYHRRISQIEKLKWFTSFTKARILTKEEKATYLLSGMLDVDPLEILPIIKTFFNN